MLYYFNGVLYASYFLETHLQNKTLVFDTNFSAIYPGSTLFDNTTSPTYSFVVSTSNPEALMVCCPGFYMVNNTTCV